MVLWEEFGPLSFLLFLSWSQTRCVCVSACACASAFCRNKTSLLDCALKTKDLLVWDCRDNWYVCYRKHFVCFLVVFHDLFPSVLFICFFGWDQNTKRFKRMLIYFNTHTQYAHFSFILCPEESTLHQCIWQVSDNAMFWWVMSFSLFFMGSVFSCQRISPMLTWTVWMEMTRTIPQT